MEERKEKAAEDTLSERARALFDESVAGLDGETLSRLNRSRQAALAEMESRRLRAAPWLPATGAAAAAVIAVVLLTRGPSIDAVTAADSVTDMEILLTEDSLEMLEDLDFYSWMDLVEPAVSEGPENHVG